MRNLNRRWRMENFRELYSEACESYLIAFCAQYEFPYEPDAWVAGDVGTIAMVGDYYFDFSVIKYAVDNSLTDHGELMEWYDYTIWASEFRQTIPNFSSWHMGCPRCSKEEMERINELSNSLRDFTNELKKKY